MQKDFSSLCGDNKLTPSEKDCDSCGAKNPQKFCEKCEGLFCDECYGEGNEILCGTCKEDEEVDNLQIFIPEL